MTGGWRREPSDGLRYLCSSSNVFSVIKLRRDSGAICVALMGDVRNAYRILVGKL